jgi:hypothetical protein
LPFDEALDADPLSVPLTPDGGAGGEPGGGRNIIACVITLLTALITLILSPPYGKAAFCRHMVRRHAGSISAKG